MSEAAVERLRAQIVAEAAKPFGELRAAIESVRAEIERELDGVSDAQARFKPPGREGEEQWCVLELLRHIIQGEEGVARRVRLLARGEPVTEPRVPGSLGGREGAALSDLKRDLAAARRSLLAAAEAVAGSEDLSATAPHPFFGELNCRAWFLFQSLHDRGHLNQLRQIKSAPGYPAA
jgi:hypothetical protein